MCANPSEDIFKVASFASLLATKISFKKFAENAIGSTSPSQVQSTEEEKFTNYR